MNAKGLLIDVPRALPGSFEQYMAITNTDVGLRVSGEVSAPPEGTEGF